MQELRYDSFPAFNTSEESTSLPAGTLVAGSKNIDLTRSIGGMARRRGLEAQIASLGSGSIRGIHNYRRSSGDRPLFGYGTGLYRMSGATSTLAKTTTADFSAGSITPGGTVENIDIVQVDGASHGTFGTALSGVRYAIKYSPNVTGTLGEVEVLLSSSATGTVQVDIYSSAGTVPGDTVMATTTVATTQTTDKWYTAAFSAPASVVAGTVYWIVLTNISATFPTLAYQAYGNYAPATALSTSSNGGAWSSGTAGYGAFKTYVTVPILVTDNDELRLARRATLGNIDQSFEAQEEYESTYSWYGQSFTPAQPVLTAIAVSAYGPTSVSTLTFKLYTSASKATLLATKVINGVGADSIRRWHTALFDTPVSVTPGVQYYFEVESSVGWYLAYNDLGTYSGGAFYTPAGQQVGSDMCFRTYGGTLYSPDATWTSPAYDSGSTPVNASLPYGETLPTGTSIVKMVRGSEDGQAWGDWQAVLTSGGGLPLTRYYQVRLEFVTNKAVTPSLQDFAITTESAWTEATSIKSGLSGNKVRFVDYRDVCYFTDGGRPQRYDGITVSDVGVDPPTTAPTLTVSGTGLTGTFQYLVTYFNVYGAESNGGTSAGITLANQGCALSAIPAGPAGTAARNIYRTKAGGSSFYFIKALADNTTTTYTDNTADTNLLTPLPVDNGIPPDATIIYQHNNYMLYVSATHPERLYFSKPGLPDSVHGNAYKGLPEAVLGVRTYQGYVVVSGKGFTAVITGAIWDKDPSIDTTDVDIIDDSYGTLSHEAMCKCASPGGDILVFPSPLGLSYLTPGMQDNSVRSMQLSQAVQGMFQEVVRTSNAQNMAAVYHNNRYLVAVNYNGEDTPVANNNVVMVYDFRTGKWSPPWYLNVSGIALAGGRLLVGDSKMGQVHELEKGTTDNGVAFESVGNIRTDYTLAGAHKRKRFKRLFVAVAPNSDTTNLDITATVDGAVKLVHPGPTSTWRGALVSNKKRLGIPKGHSLQIRITDSGAVDWVITALVVEYQVGGS